MRELGQQNNLMSEWSFNGVPVPDMLRLLAPSLGPPPPPGNWAGILQAAMPHSTAAAPVVVFEIPASDDRPDLDFSVALTLSPGVGAGLPMDVVPERIDGDARTVARWGRVAAILRECARPDSPLGRVFGQLWLEFDTSREGGTDAQLPSVFLQIADRLVRAAPSARVGAERLDGYLDLALEILHSGWWSKRQLQRLIECAAQLPAGARMFGVGVMIPRGEHATRFCARDLQHAQLARYLTAIGWPGSTKEACRIVPRFAGYLDQYRIAMDVADEIGSRLGIEYEGIPTDGRATADSWSRLLDALLSRGLVTPRKREALRLWVGESVYESGSAGAPDRIARQISHLKFVFQRQNAVEVKAYLHARYIAGESLEGFYEHLRSTR